MPVKFTSKCTDALNSVCGYLVVGVYDKHDYTPVASKLNSKTKGMIKALIDKGDLQRKAGSCVLMHTVSNTKSERILVMQLGARSEFNETRFIEAIQSVAKSLSPFNADSVCFCIDDIAIDGRDLSWLARRVVEITSSTFYKFDQLKEGFSKTAKQWQIQIVVEENKDLTSVRQGVKIGKAVSEGVRLSRDLGNLPGNICTPTYLADTALKLASDNNLEVEVLDEKQMSDLGMNSLLSVSRGSREPAKLILMKYCGANEQQAPVALVGKGLTFDAGGISIKPAAAMDEMKFDMCGGAGVIGAIRSISLLKLPVNVIGVVAASENLPDGAANKPGDIVKSMSGTTIEILNTDAEGRLILCDALTYIERFKPVAVIDAATLTGACVIALGKHPSGLFTNDDDLADEIIRAGNDSNDRVWRMPVWDEYQSQLDSNFADLANIGGRDAGAVTAACFLSRFTGKYRWAHLDIAGTAWNTGKDKGSTGRPVSLFVQFVLNRLEQR